MVEPGSGRCRAVQVEKTGIARQTRDPETPGRVEPLQSGWKDRKTGGEAP